MLVDQNSRSKSNQRGLIVRESLLNPKQLEQRVRINKVYGESVRPIIAHTLNDEELGIDIIEQAMRTQNETIPTVMPHPDGLSITP